jgi:hypothetical protein
MTITDKEEAKLAAARKECDSWDEDTGCLEDYDEECPMHTLCEKDSLGEEN